MFKGGRVGSGRPRMQETPRWLSPQNWSHQKLLRLPTWKQNACQNLRDKDVAKRKLAKLIADGDRADAGVPESAVRPSDTPVHDILQNYLKFLKSKDNTDAHCRQVIGRLSRAFEACKFARLGDMSENALLEYSTPFAKVIHHPHCRKKPEEYTVRHAAALMQVTTTAVRAAVKRHNLAAKGKGRARRLPRETVITIMNLRGRGRSIQTRNAIITDAKAFARFALKRKLIAENPFSEIKPGNIQKDRRHDRRELTHDELARLIATTEQSKRTFRDLTGLDGPCVAPRRDWVSCVGTGELAAGEFHFGGCSAEGVACGQIQ